MARRTQSATHRLVLLGLCVAVVVGCTNGEIGFGRDGPVEFTSGKGPLLRDRATSIGSVTIEVDGDELVVEFIGGPEGDVLLDPCKDQYELEVNEQTSPIEITIWHLKPTVRPEPVDPGGVAYACGAVGHQRQLRHPITGPRPSEIIDGSNDAVVPVIALTALLSPTVLPDGWAIHDTGAPPEPASTTTAFTNGASVVFLRTTLVSDAESALDRFRLGSPPPVEPPAGPAVTPISPVPVPRTVDEITIRSGIATLTETSDERQWLRFVHGSYLYELSAELDVSNSVIVAIAEGLE